MVIEAGGEVASRASKISILNFIDDSMHRAGEISIQGKDLAMNKTMISADSLQISSPGKITQDDVSRFAAQNMKISGQKLDLAGHLNADNDLTITGNTLHGSHMAVIDSKNNLTIQLDDGLWLGKMSAVNQLHFTAQELNNQGTVKADKVALNVHNLQNSSKITGRQDLIINTRDQLTQSDKGVLASGGTMHLTSAEMDTAGKLISKELKVNGNNWHNKAQVLTEGNAKITMTNTLNNSGQLETMGIGELHLIANYLINSKYMQGAQLNVTASQWDNSGEALARATITTDNVSNLNNHPTGYIKSGFGTQLDHDKVRNTGQIFSNGLQLNKDKQWSIYPELTWF